MSSNQDLGISVCSGGLNMSMKEARETSIDKGTTKHRKICVPEKDFPGHFRKLIEGGLPQNHCLRAYMSSNVATGVWKWNFKNNPTGRTGEGWCSLLVPVGQVYLAQPLDLLITNVVRSRSVNVGATALCWRDWHPPQDVYLAPGQ